jgi:hypothetical protein
MRQPIGSARSSRPGRAPVALWGAQVAVLVTFLMVLGLGVGLVLGKTLATSGRASKTTTATPVAPTTCVSVPLGTLCKTVVRR